MLKGEAPVMCRIFGLDPQRGCVKGILQPAPPAIICVVEIRNVVCQPPKRLIEPLIFSAEFSLQAPFIVGIAVWVQLFQLFGIEEVFHIFHAVFQPDLAGAFPQAIALDPGIKAFAGGLGIDKSTILGTQAAQIDREAVPEYQLAEAFLIEFDGEIALRIGGNLDGQGIFRSL